MEKIRRHVADNGSIWFVLGALFLQPLFWMSPSHEQKIGTAYLWSMVLVAFAVLLWKASASRSFLRKGAPGFFIAVWLWVTCVLNGDAYLIYNQAFIMGIVLVFGICYPAFACAPRKQVVLGLKLVGGCAVAVCAVLACLSLYATYQNTKIFSPFAELYIGISEGRLWMFALHPNEIAATFLAAFLLALYLIADARSIAAKIVIGICCVLLFGGIALTVTWTSKLAVSVGLGLLAALLLMRGLRLGKKALRCLVILGTAMAVFGLSLAAMNGTIELISAAAMKNVQGEMSLLPFAEASELSESLQAAPEPAETGTQAEAQDEMNLPQERDVIGNFGTFSGRTDIWRAGLNAIKARPSILLIGMTDGQAARVPLALGREIYHMHNTWMEMLLIGGIPGLALHLWLCFMVLSRCVRLFFAKNEKFSLRVLGMVPAVLFIPCLMEIYPTFSGTMVDMLFAMTAGAVVSLSA